MRLDDENGTLVTQSVAMADYAEDVAKVWVLMDEDLKKGKSYTVTLNYERTAANGGSHVQADAASAGDPGEAQGVIYFRSSGSAALEMPAVGDGGTLEDGITVVFDYERMNIRAFARAIFLVLVLVGLLAVPASFIQGILRKIGVGGHGACGTLTEPPGEGPYRHSRKTGAAGAGKPPGGMPGIRRSEDLSQGIPGILKG